LKSADDSTALQIHTGVPDTHENRCCQNKLKLLYLMRNSLFMPMSL